MGERHVPVSTGRQLPSADFAPDVDCEKLVEKHRSVLKSLDVAKLMMLPEGVQLNSAGIRLQQTTMGRVGCIVYRYSPVA